MGGSEGPPRVLGPSLEGCGGFGDPRGSLEGVGGAPGILGSPWRQGGGAFGILGDPWRAWGALQRPGDPRGLRGDLGDFLEGV